MHVVEYKKNHSEDNNVVRHRPTFALVQLILHVKYVTIALFITKTESDLEMKLDRQLEQGSWSISPPPAAPHALSSQAWASKRKAPWVNVCMYPRAGALTKHSASSRYSTEEFFCRHWWARGRLRQMSGARWSRTGSAGSDQSSFGRENASTGEIRL